MFLSGFQKVLWLAFAIAWLHASPALAAILPLEGWYARWEPIAQDSYSVPVWLQEPWDEQHWFPTEKPLTFNQSNKNLWLTVVLPDQVEEESVVLHIAAASESFRMWVDGWVVYTWGDTLGRNPTDSYGEPWHLIPLQKEWLGKRVYFEVHSPHRSIGFYREPSVGESDDIVMSMIREKMFPYFVGCLCILVGFLACLVYTFKNGAISPLYFGLFALSMGAYLLSTTKINLLMVGRPVAWAYINVYSVFFCPIFLGLFFRNIFKGRYWSIAQVPFWIHVLMIPTFTFLVLTDLYHIKTLQVFFNFFLLITIVVFVFLTFILSLQGNLYAKLFALGFVLFCMFGAWDVLRGLGFVQGPELSYGGVLMLGASLMGIVIHEYRSIRAQRAKLIKNMEDAKIVQETLLPKDIVIPGVEIANVYQAAEETGGDWFDLYHDAESKRLFLFIADVTGHGVSAALVTGVLSGALRSLLIELIGKGYSDGEILRLLAQRINETIQNTGAISGHLATMSFVCLNLETGELNHVNAAHTPLLFIRNSHVKSIPHRGSPIGLVKETAYDHVTFQLQPNDVLFLFTDGLLENQGPNGEMLILRHLLRLLPTWPHEPAQLAKKILEHGRSLWKNASPKDDCTFLILKWKHENRPSA